MSVEDNDKIIYKYGDDNGRPYFDDQYDASTWVIKKMRIKEGAKKVKGKTKVIFPYKLFNGDVFSTNKSAIKYYIFSWEAYGRLGGHVHVVKRLDGYPLTTIDLENLSTKSWIQIKGYVTNKKTN
jgi:hypothetical protein